MADEKDPNKDYFEGYEVIATPRFKTIPILGEDITIRVKFAIRESAELNTLTNKYIKLAEKMNEHATPGQIDAYEAAVNNCIKYIVKLPEDQEKVSKWILAPDKDADEILEIADFIEIVRRAQKLDDKAAEEDSGKASSGSDNS